MDEKDMRQRMAKYLTHIRNPALREEILDGAVAHYKRQQLRK
jgi:hypothetical protein